MDGVVQSVEAHVGEMVDPAKPPVITIVENNPLVVEFESSDGDVSTTKSGQVLHVSYDQKTWLGAKVTWLPWRIRRRLCRRVHLTLENPDGKSSGLKIFVELPPEFADAQKADGEKTPRAGFQYLIAR